MTTIPPDPITTNDVARIVGCSTNTVHGLMQRAERDGHPPPDRVRVGPSWIWSRAAVETWAAGLPERRPGNPEWIKGKQRPA